MRLKNHIINEVNKEEQFKKFLPRMEKDCKPFLNECRRNNVDEFLYRGYKKEIRFVQEIKVRKDRLPKDTPGDIHEYLDNLFHEYHKVYARSEGVFVTGNRKTSGHFGLSHIFLPIGKYKYLWNTGIEDLYSDVVDEGEFNLVWYDDDEYNNYEYEREWEEMYGAGSGNGVWRYGDIESYEAHIQEAIDDIAHKLATKDGIDSSSEEFDREMEEYENKIRIDIEWIPQIEFEDWIHSEINSKKEELEDRLENIIKRYTDKYLKKYFQGYKKHEMVFICDKYYLINNRYEEILRPMLNKQLRLFGSDWYK